MATMYALPALTNWTGAGGWSNTSGGASNGTYPGSADTAIFDANSGTARTINVPSGQQVANISCTGARMTLSVASGGYLVLIPSLTTAFNVSGFAAISGLQCAGVQANSLNAASCTINALLTSQGVTLTSSLLVTGPLILGDSAFNANGYDVTLATLSENASTGGSIMFGSGVWTFTGTGTLMALTYVSWDFGTATIRINNTSSADKFWNYNVNSGNQFWVAATGTGTLYCGALGYGSPSSGIAKFRADGGNIRFSATYQCAQNWQVAGTPSAPVVLSQNSSYGTSVNLYSSTAATWYFDYCTFANNTAANGTSTWVARSSTFSGTSSGWTNFKLRPNFIAFL
jgi:hypothetical protein